MKLLVLLAVLFNTCTYICCSISEDKFHHSDNHPGESSIRNNAIPAVNSRDSHQSANSGMDFGAGSDHRPSNLAWPEASGEQFASQEAREKVEGLVDTEDMDHSASVVNEQLVVKDAAHLDIERVKTMNDTNDLKAVTYVVDRTVSVQSDLHKAIRLSNEFGGRFYDLLAKIYPNFVFSPVTLSVLMALILRGADGHSLKEIYDTMDYKGIGFDNLQEVLNGFHELSHEFYTRDGAQYDYKSEISTSMWLSEGKRINSGFINDGLKYFHAKLYGINFRADRSKEETLKGTVSKAASTKPEDIITKWLLLQTEGRVLTCAIRREELSKDTELLFLNSMYFSAPWGDQFKFCTETTAMFNTLNEMEISTKFLQVTTMLQHYDSAKLKASIIEIPFSTKIHSLYIVLPSERDSLADVEEKMKNFNDIFDELKKGELTKLNVMIPKHVTQDSLRLDRLLPTTGIKSIFNADVAELTYISAYDHLVVNKIFHEAILEFKESGTSSEESDGGKYGKMEKDHQVQTDGTEKIFIANRPYMFLLAKRHAKFNEEKTVMFVGRVNSV